MNFVSNVKLYRGPTGLKLINQSISLTPSSKSRTPIITQSLSSLLAIRLSIPDPRKRQSQHAEILSWQIRAAVMHPARRPRRAAPGGELCSITQSADELARSRSAGLLNFSCAPRTELARCTAIKLEGGGRRASEPRPIPGDSR